MNNSDFVHLHIHSEQSLLDGFGTPQQYAQRAAKLGFPAIAITDHGNVDGHIKWQQACKEAKIIPIFGVEFYIVPDMTVKSKEQRGHLTILAQNQKGWQEICRLLTVANLEGFYHRPRIDFETLRKADHSGLILMTACAGSILLLPGGEKLITDLHADALLYNIEPTVYLEIMPHCISEQVKINELCLKLHKNHGLPIVATNDCHYIRAEQSVTQEVLLAIQRRSKWNDENRWSFGFDGLHLRTADEMITGFREQGIIPRQKYYEAMRNTTKIVELCKGFRIPKQEICLPITQAERENNIEPSVLLDNLCRGSKHYQLLAMVRYKQRYKREFELISKKKFCRYFLIVHELIEWCKENGIMVGPGRGSVGSSLIAYLLGITEVDPLQYGLLFERFISEDRIDWPDIDIDIEDTKCELVREHLEKEYGQDKVAGISTFLRMKSRAALRDVCRVFDVPTKEVDHFAKSIRAGEHDENALKTAGLDTPEGRQFSKKYPKEFRLACELEGQVKAGGQHPAGLIISGLPLTEGKQGNLARRSGKIVCNWDMSDCEHNGLIKIDVLKLSTLTVLNETRKLIKHNYGDWLFYDPIDRSCFVEHLLSEAEHGQINLGKFDYTNLPLDDPKVFKTLSEGHTASVFQLSGYACKKLCVDIGIDNFEDMAAISALARPGPLNSGMTDTYTRRKHGEKWEPIHSVYEEITKETYGVVIYQEQVMKIMTELAGFSGGDSDRIRKVIGKKRNVKAFEPYKKAFLKGCEDKNTLTQEQAKEFWKGLLKFAEYCFVKSHAIEYAVIGYYTAWLKIHYLCEFLCAQLTYGPDKESAVKEAERLGFKIVTPKSGISTAYNWSSKDKHLYMPFIEIKGVGESQAKKCEAMNPPKARRKGFFKLENPVSQTKIEQLMNDIKAFDPDPNSKPSNLLTYFQYEILRQEEETPEPLSYKRQSVIDATTPKRKCHR